MKSESFFKQIYINFLIFGSRIVRKLKYYSLKIRGYSRISSKSVLEHGVGFDKVNPKGIIIKERAKVASGTILLSHEDVLVNKDSTIVIDEGAYVGVGCIILPGAVVGRESIIGSGSVVRNIIPPYSIVIGNPAKIVGFRFNPEEIIEHEKNLYPEDKRLPMDVLEKNFNKFFINRIKEIKEYTRL